MPKFRNQKCIHCLNFFESLTEDHILPDAWYPTNTPASIEKWVVPSCQICNGKLGKMEEDLLLRMGMCVEKDDKAALGIYEKITRMINIDVAKNDRSFNRKQAALFKVVKNIKPCTGCNDQLLKHAHHWHGPEMGRMIRIPEKELSPFIAKMARGLEYKLRNKLIEEDRDIVTYRPRQNNPEDDLLFAKFEKRIASCLQTAERGPGLKISYGVNPYRDGNVIYKILIWGKFEFWAQIYPKSMIRKSAQLLNKFYAKR